MLQSSVGMRGACCLVDALFVATTLSGFVHDNPTWIAFVSSVTADINSIVVAMR